MALRPALLLLFLPSAVWAQTPTLTPASVQAMALATRITVIADSLRMDVPYLVLTSLHDVFRTALCGYGPPAPPT